jgi:hypothetical protein
MKWRVLLPALVLLCICAGRANATIWCGCAGVLDHPCSAADKPSDAVSSNAIERNQPHWTALQGVWKVGSATSAAGGRPQVQVMVDPPWADCARTRMPSSVDGIPVVVVPRSVPKTGRILSDDIAVYEYPPRQPPSRKSVRNATGAAAYARIVQDYGDRWMALPGVIGIAPAGCDCARCEYSGVEVDVQRQFLSSVWKKIPPTVKGMAVEVIPRD